MSKGLTFTAKTLSTIFSPLFIPTYGIALALMTTTLYYVEAPVKWRVVLTVLGITAMLPLIAIAFLYKRGLVSDASLNNRRERPIPYALSLLCYIGAISYLWSVHSPLWLVMFLAGGAAGLLVVFIINFWWKVSAHGAGMGGLVGMLIAIIAGSLNVWPVVAITMVTIVLCGMVGTSRLILQRHTLLQVAAGVAIGFCAVFFPVHYLA